MRAGQLSAFKKVGMATQSCQAGWHLRVYVLGQVLRLQCKVPYDVGCVGHAAARCADEGQCWAWRGRLAIIMRWQQGKAPRKTETKHLNVNSVAS